MRCYVPQELESMIWLSGPYIFLGGDWNYKEVMISGSAMSMKIVYLLLLLAHRGGLRDLLPWNLWKGLSI